MTHFKRIVAVLLALVMVLGLTACGRFETDMAKAAKDMKNLESLRVDIDSDIILGMAVLGENKNFDLDLNGTAEVRRHPLTGKAALRMNMLGDAQEFPVYFFQNRKHVLLRDSFNLLKYSFVSSFSLSPLFGISASSFRRKKRMKNIP